MVVLPTFSHLRGCRRLQVAAEMTVLVSVQALFPVIGAVLGIRSWNCQPAPAFVGLGTGVNSLAPLNAATLESDIRPNAVVFLVGSAVIHPGWRIC